MYVHDTWAARDLPVLDATIGLLEHSYMVTVTDIADKMALDPSVVAQALEALDPVYVDFRKTATGGDPRFWYVFKVTPEARRAVGQWPTAEALVSRLAEELSAAARREDNAEHQGLLMYAARLIGDTLRDSAVRAAGAVLAPAFGGIPVPEMGQQVPPPAPRPEVEFQSLVPLPELPELLRPQRPDGLGQPESATEQAEPAPTPAPDQSAWNAFTREPSARIRATPEPSASEPSLSAEAKAAEAKAAAAAEQSTDVPDLAPWPDGSGRVDGSDRAETSAAARSLAPQPEPTPFRSPPGIWPAADADPDAADTDLDMVEARQDAV